MVSIKLINAWIASSSHLLPFKSLHAATDEGYATWGEFYEWVTGHGSVVTRQEEWELIGEKITSDPAFSYLKDLAILAGGVELGYWVALHWVLPIHIPVLKIESYKQNRDGSTGFELIFQGDAKPSKEVFYMLRGFLRNIPKVFFNAEPCEIDLTIRDQSAHYLIHSSVSDQSFLVDSVKKTISNVPPLQSLTKEFALLQKQMMSYYESGEEKEKRLKLMEQLLQASSKLSQIGESAASIVHEINNPLTIATMLLDNVSDHLSKNDVKKATSQLEKAKKTLVKIGKTVKSIQGLLQNEKRIVFVDTPLQYIVDEGLSLLEHRIQETGTKVETHFRPTLSFECDEIQFTQVFSNLIGNSIDEIEPYKHKWVKITAEEEGSTVVIRVSDSGFGIPNAIRSRVFEPLLTTKPKFKGTGFGLSIVKRIVESHGGKIEIDTTSKHTCFVIRMPKAWTG